MNHAEFHKQARILDGPEYDGQLVDNLVAAVNAVPETDPKFYRPAKFTHQRVTSTDTPSTVSGWAYEGDGCSDCGAAYGHTILCPLINREVAEARSAMQTPTEADKIHAHALGIQL